MPLPLWSGGVALAIAHLRAAAADAAAPGNGACYLSTLQTHSPALPFAAIAEVVHEDLGVRGAELLERMERRPIAAASIGHVHRASLAGQRVAVKVQYPNIEKALQTEFRAARARSSTVDNMLPTANPCVRLK